MGPEPGTSLGAVTLASSASRGVEGSEAVLPRGPQSCKKGKFRRGFSQRVSRAPRWVGTCTVSLPRSPAHKHFFGIQRLRGC